MSFIKSEKTQERFFGAKHVTHLYVTVKSDSALIKEEFLLSELIDLKSQLEEVVEDINIIIGACIETDKEIFTGTKSALESLGVKK